MKTIYSIGLFIALICLTTACQNDDAVAEQPAVAVDVTDGGTTLAAEGGNSTLVVTNSEEVTASAEDSWLKVAVDKGKVTVSADKNNSLQTRNTLVHIEAPGLKACDINIIQMGAILYLKDAPSAVIVNDDEHIKDYDLVGNIPVQVSSGVDWAKVSVENNKFSIHFNKNDEGRIREGYVYYQNGLKKDSLLIRQGEYKDIEGYYYLVGLDPLTGEQQVTVAAVGSTDNYSAALTILLEAGDKQISRTTPVTFDEENLSLRLDNMSYLGTVEFNDTTRHLACVMGNYSSGSSVDNAISADFVFKCNQNGKTTASLTDNGSWSSNTVNMLSVMQFLELPMTTDNALTTPLLRYALPTLVEYRLAGAATRGASIVDNLRVMAKQKFIYKR